MKKFQQFLGVYYRYPKKLADIFVEKIQDTLTPLINFNEITMINMDFNYDTLKHQYNSLITEVLIAMCTSFLQPHALEPTIIY